MSLSPGHKLAHYEILEPIGKGGMGEVYRSRDGKLGRDVAIKVLPDEFAQDPERLRRFQREAKVLAALNHPNIASIYGLEQSAKTHYLVLELVPGETLAVRIARGPIPVSDVLDIAMQIVDALEAAHEQGIVHRDLKPANIKITEDGKVIVLDFGLAKAFVDDAPEADSSMSPTITRDATRAGVILGTAAYMSPEQAKGKRVDKRADIWAFGVLLYEMLTGSRAFAGEDVSDTLAYVLTKEPDWEALPAKTPASLWNLMQLCVAKEPKKRARDIGDVRLAMEGAFETVGTAQAEPSPSTSGWGAQWWIVAVLAASLATGLGVWSLTRPGLRPATRFAIAIPTGDRLLRRQPLALSDDGRTLIYVSVDGESQHLAHHPLHQLDGEPIPGTDGALMPFLSPDGQWVGFATQHFARGSLKRVALAGGPALTVSSGMIYSSPHWGPDNTIVFWNFEGLWQVPVSGGEPRQIATAAQDDGIGFREPRFLPSGQAVLFTIRSDARDSQVAVLSLETGEQRVLLQGQDARYARSGYIVFARESSLWRAPFDADALELTGEPALVLNGVQALGASASFTIGGDGSLAYIPDTVGTGGELSEGILVWVDREGEVTPVTASSARYHHQPRLSPDGTHLAVVVESEEGGDDIWIHDLERGTRLRLTSEGTVNHRPVWTPDGRTVVFQSNRTDRGDLFSRSADGSGVAEQLLTLAGAQYPESFSPEHVLTIQQNKQDERDRDIWVWPPDGEPVPFLSSRFHERQAVFSSDGRWIAYISDESGRFEVYVQPYPGPGGKIAISTDGGQEAMWSRDGRELFFRTRTHMMAVNIAGDPSAAGPPRALFETGSDFAANDYMTTYDVAPDGRFLMIQRRSESGDPSVPPHIIVVENWFDELERSGRGK